MPTGSTLGNMKNIIVLGETGSGKSSLINMVVGRDVAEISDAATGCTFSATKYTDGKGNNFFDTVGLNESSRGTVTSIEAIRNLAKLFKSLESGVNLIIFVIRKGRITEAMVKNYTIFVHGVCEDQVPVLLAISGCEMDEDPNKWFNENKMHFDKHKMVFDAVVSGCFAKKLDTVKQSMQPVILEAYEETDKRMSSTLTNKKYTEAFKFGSWDDWLKKVIVTIWNELATVTHILPQIPVWESLTEGFIKTMGMNKADATSLANDLANSVE